MPRVKVHRNQLTLPEDLRRALHLADEDYVDAELVEDGILLKPSRKARRRAALADIRAAQAGVRPSPEMAALSPTEREQAIAELLEADEADRTDRA